MQCKNKKKFFCTIIDKTLFSGDQNPLGEVRTAVYAKRYVILGMFAMLGFFQV